MQTANIRLISKTEAFCFRNGHLPISDIQAAINKEIDSNYVQINGVEYYDQTSKKWK